MGLEGENLIYLPPRIVIRRSTNTAKTFNVESGDLEQPNPGYFYQRLSLKEGDDLKEEMNGALYKLRSHSHTNPARIVAPVDCLETVVNGAVNFLAQDPLGRIHDLHLTADMQRSVRYGMGWTICLVGRAPNSTVLGVYKPRFTDDMEQTIRIPKRLPKKIDRNGIHPRYWERLKHLIQT